MKTIANPKNLLLFVLLFSSTLILADTHPTKKSTAASTEKTIHDYFKFPNILIPQNKNEVVSQKVEVIFTTNQKGHVNFVLAKTEDPLLKKEIEEQFSKLSLTHLKQQDVHSVTLNFKTFNSTAKP